MTEGLRTSAKINPSVSFADSSPSKGAFQLIGNSKIIKTPILLFNKVISVSLEPLYKAVKACLSDSVPFHPLKI